ncbi:MAG: hypothetical protein P0Y65_17425 [Candidatus Devosia phytovorans]|uniref:Type II toxin-antitoxin system RelE/ParE family toxin n=1 Tax=Candidatus Devosia phytovorans TaxID=3121372 RepID=A0AAJ6AYT7_9HYPH|nr:hypothetical protein [Devosia sp.]WEK03950.1 MAG: hypothetical protein P0Y65_17425 [Devosia sp.]
MRVRLSADALRGKTNSGIASFRNVIRRGLTLLHDRPGAGFTDSRIPIQGARRIIVDGWYFDYDVIGDAIWVHRITSSVNTPSLSHEDDFDYERPPAGSSES